MVVIAVQMKYEYVFNDLSALEIECKLRQIIENALYQKYGDKPDELIKKRIIDEWAAMERSDTVLDVAALYELVIWLKKNNHPYWMRGCAGSSLILYLLGITFGNPLPPHYHCPVCHSVQWETDYLDGFDLPKKKTCEQDQATLIPDGHNVPWQTLWGYGEHIPVFDIDLPKNLRDDFLVILKNHWLRKKESDASVSLKMNSEKLSASLSNISFAFCLECSSIHKTFHSKTVDASCVNISLSAWQTLLDYYDGYNEQSILGTNTFADLISFSGIIHATGAWDDEAVFMNRYLDYAPSELIAFRDDIFHYLIEHGFLEKDAWRGMNYVRKGLDLPVITEEMKHSRDKWVLDRCKRIEYLFPKAHAVENIMFRLKAAILPENTQRISTGYAVIDDTLDGIDRSDVIILGARVAMGKTTFALDVAYALATTAYKKVAIFTPTDNVKNILEGLKRRADTDCPQNISLWTGDTLCTKSLRNKLNANDVDFLIIDCLQSFEPVGTKNVEQVETTMQELKQLAKDKNVPMLVLTQLSRKVERRKEHIPLVKDIPYCKSVVPFADSILLLYREAYYDPNADRSIAWCFIEKNARGGLGAMPLIWNDEKIGFENPAPSCHAE